MSNVHPIPAHAPRRATRSSSPTGSRTSPAGSWSARSSSAPTGAIDYNRKLAQIAERSGFEYALSQVRYMASYGADQQHESTGFSLALLLATERLKVIAAIHPGLWHPGVLAKFVATADQLSNGRCCVNVVSGWFKGEFTAMGEPWLEHDERYRRSEEFIRALRGIWTEDGFNFSGDFYRFHDFNLKPKPVA